MKQLGLSICVQFSKAGTGNSSGSDVLEKGAILL